MTSKTLTARVAAGLSTLEDTAKAAAEAAVDARGRLTDAEVDLAFVFLSPHHLDGAEEAAASVRSRLEPRHVVGCVAEGIVGGARELEEGPAIAVWAASLPGAGIEPFHAAAFEVDGGIAVAGFPDATADDLVLMLVDPFSFPVSPFLGRLNEERPGLAVVGGIASGAGRPEGQAFVVDGDVHAEGMAGVVLSDAPAVTLVSQGCAPIGRDAVVTGAEENVILELAGKPALERLRSDLAALSPREQALAAQGVLVGLVIDENRPEYGPGDYLMRGLIGVDEETGALAVGEEVRTGQTVRFHVRDADSADADLRRALREAIDQRGATPTGALLFTCNGRGSHMFAVPDHDARLVSEIVGEGLAGFFCGGEIGPVGGRTFLHGFTATAALF